MRGFSPLHAGLLTLPMAVVTGLLPPLSGRLVGTRGPRISLLVGGAGIALAGLIFLLVLEADTPLGLLALAYVVFGIGFGMVNAPITTAAVSGMPLAGTATTNTRASSTAASTREYYVTCTFSSEVEP